MALTIKFRGDSAHLDKALKKIAVDVGTLAKDTAGQFAKIGSAMAAAALTGAAAFGGFKIAEFVKDSSAAAASMESLQMQFATMLKSGDKAKSLLGDMRKLGADTPLEFKDIAEAGKSLLAFGEDSKGLVATLRRIGDVSSGIGAGIGEIADIYGKARVQGTLFAEDINQLTGRGIPVIQEFAKQLSVSQDQVKKLASEGKVTFPMLEQAFVSLTSGGGKFEGMMAQMAATTEGKISNMKDSWESLKVVFGSGLNEGLKPWIDKIGGDLSNLAPLFTKAGEASGTALIEALNGRYALFVKGGAVLGEALKLGLESTVGNWVTNDLLRKTIDFFDPHEGDRKRKGLISASDQALGPRMSTADLALEGSPGLTEAMNSFQTSLEEARNAQRAESDPNSRENLAMFRRAIDAQLKEVQQQSKDIREQTKLMQEFVRKPMVGK